VPAERLRMGVVDRIFARVGAQDDLAAQRSTFMVEMIETANILRNATPRSLLVLDEIGRGTSTFDGIAVARAVVEHIHDSPRLGCKTLFATHYHELADLAAGLERVTSLRVAVLERGEEVVFLHRVEPGAADRSYGVHVARLAGVPEPVTRRAAAILADLERNPQPGHASPAHERRPDFSCHPGPSCHPERSEGSPIANRPVREGDGPRLVGSESHDREPRAGDTHAPPNRANGHAPLASPDGHILAPPAPHPAVRRLRGLDPLRMTPIEALAELEALARLAAEDA
jgi:DNA mismatch repair protein MutS